MAGFSNPIPRATQPRFAEGSNLASNRDDRNNSKLWKKNRTSVGQLKTDGNALALLQRQVASMRRVKSGGFVQTTKTETFFPFKIYNIDNATDSSLSYRTFQIRSGLVGYRPQYIPHGFDIVGFNGLLQGNFELSLVATGTDFVMDREPYLVNQENSIYSDAFYGQPTINTGGNVVLPLDGTPTLICSNKTLYPYVNPNPPNVQIVIPPSDIFQYASFWVVIHEDSTYGSWTELWGKCFFPAYHPGQTEYSLYDTTIGIGSVYVPQENIPPTVVQIQDGHLCNRYLEKQPQTNPSGSPVHKYAGFGDVYRGYWTENSLANKIIYPGDIIVDDTYNFFIPGDPSFPLTSIGNCYKSWVFKGLGQAETFATVEDFRGSPSSRPWEIVPRDYF